MDEQTQTTGTALQEHSTGSLDLTALPARLDNSTLAMVEQVARAPLPALAPCDDDYLVKCLRMMQAAIPRQRSDELGGSLLLQAYKRQLSGYPRRAITFLTDTAIAECEWFPQVAKCREILARWKRDDEAQRRKQVAGRITAQEWQARLDDVAAALRRQELDQDAIDALPERLRAILETRSLLWRCDCGSYVARPVHPDENKRNESEIAD